MQIPRLVVKFLFYSLSKNKSTSGLQLLFTLQQFITYLLAQTEADCRKSDVISYVINFLMSVRLAHFIGASAASGWIASYDMI